MQLYYRFQRGDTTIQIHARTHAPFLPPILAITLNIFCSHQHKNLSRGSTQQQGRQRAKLFISK